MRTRSFLVALAFLALPAAAQQGGSTNVRTPTMSVAITFHDGRKLELEYRALAWAQGLWEKDARKEKAREFLNADMQKNPTGSLVASHDLTLSDRIVKAGTYELYFAITPELGYELVLADEAGQEQRFPLPTSEAKEQVPRLVLSLAAGQSEDRAELHFAYGKFRATLPVVASATPKEPAPKGEGKKQ